METVIRQVTCSKETVELGEGLDKFIEAVQTAVADGWQFGQDIPTIIAAAIGHLLPALEGVEKIGAETEDIQAFVNAVYIGLSPIPFRFVKPAEPPAETP